MFNLKTFHRGCFLLILLIAPHLFGQQVCDIPRNILLNRTSNTAVSITADDLNANYQIEAYKVGFTPKGKYNYGMSNLSFPYTRTDLNPAIEYDFYIRKKCDNGSFSSWVGPYYLGLYDENNVCTAPQLTITEINPFSIRLESKIKNPVIDIEIVPANGSRTGSPTLDDFDSRNLISGLNPSTVYDAYIRTDCGQNNFHVSNWSSPIRFTTIGIDNYMNENCFDNSEGMVNNTLFTYCDDYVPVLQERTVNESELSFICFNFDESGNQGKVNSCIESASAQSTSTTASDADWSNYFYLAPNPTSGLITLGWTQEVNNLITEIYIISLNGAYQIPINFQSSDGSVTIDLSSYPPGQYVAKFILNNGVTVNKQITRSI